MPERLAELLQEWALAAGVPIPFAVAFVSIAAAILLAVGWSWWGLESALIAGGRIIGTDRGGRPRRKKIQMRWTEWSP